MFRFYDMMLWFDIIFGPTQRDVMARLAGLKGHEVGMPKGSDRTRWLGGRQLGGYTHTLSRVRFCVAKVFPSHVESHRASGDPGM